MRPNFATQLLFCLCLAATAAITAQAPPLTYDAANAAVVRRETPADDAPNTLVGVDAQGHTRTVDKPQKKFGFRQGMDALLAEIVDEVGNRSVVARDAAGRPLDVLHDFRGLSSWYDRYLYDQKGELLLSSVVLAEDRLAAQAAKLGINPAFPDWLQVTFPGARTLREVRLYSLQDDFWANPADPLTTPNLTFSLYGVTDYEVQYWNGSGWVSVPGGFVVANRQVLSRVNLANVTTNSIRVMVRNAGTPENGYSRIVELEAIDAGGLNVAAASRGATATASSANGSDRVAAKAIDGNRKTTFWSDATPAHTVSGVAGTTRSVLTSHDGAYTTTTYSNGFAKATITHKNGPIPAFVPMYQNVLLQRERIEIQGKVFEAARHKTYWGIEEWDNFGGARILTYDWAGRISYISDQSGDVVRIVRDTQGRPKAVFLGEQGYIEYTYDAEGRLATKSFANRSTGQVWYKIDRTKAPAQNAHNSSREVTRAYLPGYGPVVEWDRRFGQPSGDGLIVASLMGYPYALIPLQPVTPSYNNSAPIRRTFTLFSEQEDPYLLERIEYTDEEMYVSMPTGAEGPLASEHQAVIRFPRFAEWTEMRRASLEQESPVFLAKSAGEIRPHQDGQTADNDDGAPVGRFSDTIDVIDRGPTVIIIFVPEPPRSGRRPGGNQNETNPPPPPHDPANNPVFPDCPPATGEHLQLFTDAREIARDKLGSRTCQQLFRSLTRQDTGRPAAIDDALAKLGEMTMQEGANCVARITGGDSIPCADGVNLWGISHSTERAGCDGFWNMTPDRAAISILHETLHTLGVRDKPGRSLSERICMSCGFSPGINCSSIGTNEVLLDAAD